MVVFRSQDLPQTQAAPCGVQAEPHSGCPSACSCPCPAGICLLEEKQEVKAETWAHFGVAMG